MNIVMRIVGAAVLIVMAVMSVFLSIAAREAPADTWWAFWYIYGLVAGACMVGVYVLLWPILPGWAQDPMPGGNRR